jgi:hypothetical protein
VRDSAPNWGCYSTPTPPTPDRGVSTHAKSASGGPTGGLSARARDAGGKALPAPQAESRKVEGCSRVRFARASVRRGGEALPRRAGGAALDQSEIEDATGNRLEFSNQLVELGGFIVELLEAGSTAPQIRD